jgi:tetratricopeptide (TPR) repeat protein
LEIAVFYNKLTRLNAVYRIGENLAVKKTFWTFCFLIILLAGCAGSRKLVSPKSDQSREPDPRSLDLFIDGVVFDLDQNFGGALLSYNEALLYDWKSPTIYKNIGRDYLWLGKEESAFIMLKRAILIDPKDVETRGLIARLQAGQGNWAAAEKEYRTVLSIDSTSLDACYQLALLYLRRNETQKAIVMYRRILRNTDKFDPQIYAGLAELYLNQKQYAEAESVFRKLLDIDSTEALGYYGLGTVKEAAKDTAGAEGNYINALDLNPNLTEARDRLGDLYAARKQWDKALGVYREGITADSSDASNWLSVGDLYRQKGDTVRATEAFQAVKNRFPNNWQAYLNLGRILMDQGKNREAHEQFKKVVELSPQNFWGHLMGGISLVHQDSSEQSIPWLQNAIELNPNDPLGNYYLGTALSQSHKPLDAIPHLEMALKARPDWVSALSVLAGVYESLKNYAMADSFFNAALKIDPVNSLVLNNYGYSLSERGIRLGEALEMAKKAVEKDPDNGAYLDTMGWILYKMGDYEKARPFIEKAFGQRGNSVDVIGHLGDLYDKLQMKDDARKMWEKALELDKSNVELQKKLGRSAEKE